MPAALRRIHSKYLGEKTFPKEIAEFEIWEVFTLSAADLRAIRVDSNKKSRLAMALQVGFLRMTGAALDTHITYLARSWRRALSRRPMTRHRHQNWGCRYLGISRLSGTDEQALFDALTAEMSVTVDREQQIMRAHEIFWNRRWRIPARSRHARTLSVLGPRLLRNARPMHARLRRALRMHSKVRCDNRRRFVVSWKMSRHRNLLRRGIMFCLPSLGRSGLCIFISHA